MNGYLAFFKGRRVELRAASLYAAKLAALAEFKPNKRDAGLVSVELAELADGTPATHIPTH